jgi:HD superfamily phosphohydrolase
VKTQHEIFDPIHDFILFSSDERQAIDSRPVQRLRHIHQLGLTSFVYPGATHKRFEHSLGVMELATRVYYVITQKNKVSDEILKVYPEIADDQKREYWRSVLRMAALCHDVGHLPFSHTAEKRLLPEGWNHERLTMEVIKSEELTHLWSKMRPPIDVEDVMKIAVGPEKATDCMFTSWEQLLSEIITGDAFGVDRMDYLLRDSHSTGMVYGRFDHVRLIDTLKILTPPSPDESGIREAELGIEEGGLHSAEALLLARYFMFSQAYYHPVRRIYDIHLGNFLHSSLPGGEFATDAESLLRITDSDIFSQVYEAAFDPTKPGHEHARRIVLRDHFKVLYRRNPYDIRVNPDAVEGVGIAAQKEFGIENVEIDVKPKKDGGMPNFLVEAMDGRVVYASDVSQVTDTIPDAIVEYVFINPELRDKAQEWLRKNLEEIIQIEGGNRE